MAQRAHILGVCGTFMASLAILLKHSGWQITGSDKAAYPPMADMLAEQGIEILPEDISLVSAKRGMMVVGNSLSRGHPMVEMILDKHLDYTSGAELLAKVILPDKHIMAISGTHGKTTSSSMLAWILHYAGKNPGFLIGGNPSNFNCSARVSQGNLFVIEADEYDTAFFDKRSKFLHYRPNDLLIHNIEYDHADIFPDLAAIQTQFHYLVRTIPSTGNIIWDGKQQSIADTIAIGCWSKQTKICDQWQLLPIDNDSTDLQLYKKTKKIAKLKWQMRGKHNATNALASIVMADKIGVSPQLSIEALHHFAGVMRRQQLLYDGITKIYDDFAHHPTAIATTLAGFREVSIPNGKLVALVHLASNSMRCGIHKNLLIEAFKLADYVLVYQQDGHKNNNNFSNQCPKYDSTHNSEASLLLRLKQILSSGDRLVIMSNGDLGKIREQAIELAKSLDN